MRKKVDARVRELIDSCVQSHHRSFFVIVGDHAKDCVVNLHYMLSKARVSARPSVLWCYKKELGFSSHRKKRMKQIKKQIQRGLHDPNKDDPFELFISSTDIRYCYYKETDNILGNTYGMCVLQDFEAITPNLLAKTIETVEGGGVVAILLKTMASLRQLYAMSMDVHARYRTEAHSDVVARFNERFILSLGSCGECLVVDDELNVLPISNHARIPVTSANKEEQLTPSQIELKQLKESLADTQPIGSLVTTAKTLDQAKAVLTFADAISEKTLRSTVALTAARGRGKSAALGTAVATAVAFGYSNIFITSPSPENLKTLFQFIFKGFDALGYEEHLDYDIITSTNPDFNNAVVRVNIFRNHRQTIQDAHVLGQAELLVIDEAAAIPLPLVRKMLGPYLVFMASTINGYEGTGRSLSLKLIKDLRDQSASAAGSQSVSAATTTGGRVLREIKLDEPIRYASGDQTEAWLNRLLCLDTSVVPRSLSGCPHPRNCELYRVDRDTLFSYHKASESFLQRMMSLYVSSHYKNSPNDLQLLSDAPAHQLYVLLPPVDERATTLPEILCVVQVCLEGEISKQVALTTLAKGQRNSGDLIPWTVSQQYQDPDFPSLSGARVVRIATHPEYQKMGYGSRALELLHQFYQGDLYNMNEGADSVEEEEKKELEKLNGDQNEGDLLTETIRPRKNLPPLLVKINEQKPERLHYMGVSFGLTSELHRFWKKAGYVPVYLRQTPNDLTGEHTCIMLKSLRTDGLVTSCAENWLDSYFEDFQHRFLSLLSYRFRAFTPVVALSIFEGGAGVKKSSTQALTKADLDRDFSPYDLKRLDSYANSVVDYHVILDMLPRIAVHHFTGKVSAGLSPVQAGILLGVGLQHKSFEDLEKDIGLMVSQIQALFMKVIRKFTQIYNEITQTAVAETVAIPEAPPSKSVSSDSKRSVNAANDDDDDAWDPTTQTLDDELDEAGRDVDEEMRSKQRELIDSLSLDQYAIAGSEKDWKQALDSKKRKGQIPSSVAILNPESSKKRKYASVDLSADLEKDKKKNHKPLKRN